MKAAFTIYCRAVGFYALLTLPVLFLPVLYFMSLMYVLIYGWIACLVFSLVYLLLNRLPLDFVPKLFALFTGVVVSVGCAYHMIGVLGVHEDVWHSGFIIFPFAALIAGWISVFVSKEKIRSSCYFQEEASAG
ncbi:MAG: hypothetical protein ACHQFX_06255 [Chitinophagales bacterium]